MVTSMCSHCVYLYDDGISNCALELFFHCYMSCVFAAFGPKPDEDKEPEPPEPFEYTED
jgi:hypothetical protein